MAAKWLIPTLIYILAAGGLGVTSKLALRHLRWQDLILWSGISFVCVAVALLIVGRAHVQLVAGSGWAVLTAAAAITSLIVFYVALVNGEAAKVVPVSAAYPVVTLLLAALFLSEGVTVVRAVGVLLVVGGVVVLTGAR